MKHQCFDFQAKIFQVEGGYFFASRPEGDIYYRISLADGLDASLKIESLCREFAISKDSEDDALLDKVRKGLKFVKQIAPGDRIPNEILDGTASWSIEEKHVTIVKNRLSAQLLNWVSEDSGSDRTSADINAIFSDESVKSSMQAAFAEAAEKLGFGPGQGDRVVALIERLSNELAYIEALREFYAKIFKIQACLPVLAHVLANDKMASQEVGRVKDLIRRPLTQYKRLFNNVDAQTGEVLSALRNISLVSDFIRKTRDDLHEDSMLWADIVSDWIDDPTDNRKREYQKITKLYRFLAQHFLEDQD